jgi:hypothetical protein
MAWRLTKETTGSISVTDIGTGNLLRSIQSNYNMGLVGTTIVVYNDANKNIMNFASGQVTEVQIAPAAPAPAPATPQALLVYLKDNFFFELGAGGSVWGAITGALSDQTDLQTALNGKEPTIAAGLTSQYWRGDKTWQTLPTGLVLANGEGTTASGSAVNLGGGNSFTASRVVDGNAQLYSFTWQNFQQLAYYAATFYAQINNSIQLLAGNGIMQISSGINVLIGTKKVNNLTVPINGYLRNLDASGTAEWSDAPIKKIGNQTLIGSAAYVAITGLSYALAANTTYKICGSIIWQSTATNNGIGFSYLAMAGLIFDKMSVQILDNPTAAEVRNGTSAGAGSHTTTTTSEAPANTSYLATFEMNIITGASPVTFQPSCKSEGQGGATVSVMSGSFMTIETI